MLAGKPGDRERLVQSARSLLNVKFRHRGRNPAVGLDCAGLVVCSFKLAGFEPVDKRTYGREPHNDGLREVVEANLGKPIPLNEAQPGDIVLLKFDIHPHHLGILGDHPLGGLSLIHAYAEVGKVVEHRFDRVWVDRVCDVYRLPVN